MTLIPHVATAEPAAAIGPDAIGPAADWEQSPLPDLIEHIQRHYHRSHREELPRLMAMAHRVERIHAQCSDAPHGLHTHLESMFESMEAHIKKEEEVLFPLLRYGFGTRSHMPVQILREEHRDQEEALARTRALCTDFSAPAQACATWIALYAGLETFERSSMDSIALENRVLFPRGLRG